MTSRNRREALDREPSLRAIAYAQPLTARGFAASKGVRLPRAIEVGSTVKIAGRFRWEDRCTAESFCDQSRVADFLWCERHVARARQLGAQIPGVQW